MQEKTPNKKIKVLLEMRPALEGFAGIPQEVRLLFRGLHRILSPKVVGKASSNTHARILSFWSRFENIFKRILPRTKIPLMLEPLADLKPIDASKGVWCSEGDDPQFDLVFDKSNIRAGWYYLETSLLRNASYSPAKLYFDVGRGVSEQSCIRIPVNRRGVVAEVFSLPNDIRALRWDPLESVGQFAQAELILHRITKLESVIHQFGRVFFDLWRFRDRSAEARKGLRWAHLFKLREGYRITADLRLAPGNSITYAEFIRVNDSLTEHDKETIKKHIPSLPIKPLISIIMPVYNPQLDHFRQALNSVLAQFYPNWELCLADDASTDQKVADLIREYSRTDARIKAIFRPVNGHISAASNSALNMANGEFVALMDQDDLLPPHALYHVAVEINRYPDVGLIYSDEDKISESGERLDPYFKPDWSPDLFCSHNLITHLGVYRTSLVREIGGFRVGYEGSQDYDLARRVIEKITPEQIRHIPRVLYHWRIHDQSTALAGADNKLYAYEAAKKTLNEYLASRGGYVEDGPFLGSYRARFRIPQPEPLVSLIIPTRDKVDVLKACIESIRNKTTYPHWEILVVDNQSADPLTLAYFDQLSHDERIRIIQYDAPFNYSAINNYAVRHAKGSLIGLINNDIEVIDAGWLEEMVSHAMRPEIGAVGAKLLYPDGRIQHSGVILGLGGLAAHAHRFFDQDSPGYCGHAKLIKNYSAVTGACLLVKKALYEEAGGLDETNLPVAYNDVDFCLRLVELGYRNLYTPYAVLHHHESLSRGAEDTPEKIARFEAETRYMRSRWGHVLDNDPAYNPNLTTSAEDFSFNAARVKSVHHGYPLQINFYEVEDTET